MNVTAYWYFPVLVCVAYYLLVANNTSICTLLASTLKFHPLYFSTGFSRVELLENGTNSLALRFFLPFIENERGAMLLSSALHACTAYLMVAASRRWESGIAYLLNPIVLAGHMSLSLDVVEQIFLSFLTFTIMRSYGSATPTGPHTFAMVVSVVLLTSLNVQYAVLCSIVYLILLERRLPLVFLRIITAGLFLLLVGTCADTIRVEHTPNAGLYWYMFQLMFPSFRKYFICLVVSFPFLYALPLLCKAHGMDEPRRSLFLTSVLNQVIQFHNLQPTLPSLVFAYHLSYTCQPSLCRGSLRYLFLVLGFLVGSTVMMHVYLHSWLVLSRTNANFLYFSTLAFAVPRIIFVTQLVSSTFREEEEHKVKQE